MREPDWTALAAAVLAEVGLTFDDVVELGRDWVCGPPGFEVQTDEPAWRGHVHRPDSNSSTSRQRYTIAITGPVDAEEPLWVLAHECGHIACNAWTSEPQYIHEFRAERYAHEAFVRHVGREPKRSTIEEGKAYVQAFCKQRYASLGADPHKGWRRDIVEWCGWQPPKQLTYRP